MTILPFIEETASTTPEAVVAAASISFVHFSSLAARDAPELRIKAPCTHISRQDIVKCLEKATGRRFEEKEKVLVGQVFSLDASTSSLLINWDEFRSSLLKLKELKLQNGPTRPFTNSRARLLAARKKGSLATSSTTSLVPLTSSQQIGWGHASEGHSEESKVMRAALKGSDVTRGGEGTSLVAYYGASLGRTF
jgi:hypothetical protein